LAAQARLDLGVETQAFGAREQAGMASFGYGMRAMSDPTPTRPRCEKCSRPRRWVGFLPHPNDATRRVHLYVCEQCRDQAEVVVPAS
jgi:hypothetical protein